MGRLQSTQLSQRSSKKATYAVAVIILGIVALHEISHRLQVWLLSWSQKEELISAAPGMLYSGFPVPGDPFHFIPCTPAAVLPPLNDLHPEKTWAGLFDPDPHHWSWGKPRSPDQTADPADPYAKLGIYLCGYLDVPLDYTNKSDARVARLAVTKFQVSGVARVDDSPNTNINSAGRAGKKSERTIVRNPGGPGGSGTRTIWMTGELETERYSDGTFDILGWDPRGVNASLPAVSCFPHDADRDRWAVMQVLAYEGTPSPEAQLEFLDALNDATLRSCWERYGDLGRFVSTAFVARDVEEIRKALGESELNGYFVSYGTGIAQTYASMFPNSTGRVILDGTEYVRDERLQGGFGWSSIDNGTDAWNDGFLGECIHAGPQHCALAQSVQGKEVTVDDLKIRMQNLFQRLIHRPLTAYLEDSGPFLVTHAQLIRILFSAMYNANTWPAMAQMLYDLEAGNTTLAASFLNAWSYDPSLPCPITKPRPSSIELTYLVICSDSYDDPQPNGLDWWLGLWTNMTEQSWIGGSSLFSWVFPCRHFTTYWPQPAEVYRGDLNHTLKNPVLIVSEPYDPATPLSRGRKLFQEMGENARFIVHHGYGHSSRDISDCTNSILRTFMLNGTLPENAETDCYANEKPYLYGVRAGDSVTTHLAKPKKVWDPVADWREHLETMGIWGLRR